MEESRDLQRGNDRTCRTLTCPSSVAPALSPLLMGVINYPDSSAVLQGLGGRGSRTWRRSPWRERCFDADVNLSSAQFFYNIKYKEDRVSALLRADSPV